MERSDIKYSQYLQILREELLPARVCLAFAAA